MIKHTVQSLLLRISGMMRQVTGRKIAERERTQAQQSLAVRNADLERIAFVVSHELRAPVATILSLVGLMNDPETDEITRAECMAGLVACATTLDETVADLNGLAATTSNEPTDLTKGLNQ